MAVNDYIALVATDVGDTGRLKPHVIEKLNNPEPDQTPFLRLLRSMGNVQENCTQMDVRVQYEFDAQRDMYIVGGTAVGSASSTGFTVDNTGAFTANDAFEVLDVNGAPLGEVIKISSVGSATAFTSATRGAHGSTATASITAGCVLRKLARYSAEGGAAGDAVQRATDAETQYLGIMTTTANITDIAQRVGYYGTPEVARVEAAKFRDFSKDRESNLLFGTTGNKDTSSSTATVWAPKGLRAHAAQWNNFNAGGTATYDLIIGALQSCNRLGGPAQKTLFMGNYLAAQIAKLGVSFGIARDDATSETLKLNINQITTPGLAMGAKVVVSYLMEGRNEIIIADMRGLQIGQLGPMEVDKGPGGYGIQTPGTRTKKWQIIAREGLLCSMPFAQGIITNVNRVVA